MPIPDFARRLPPLLLAASAFSSSVAADDPTPLMTLVVEGTPSLLRVHPPVIGVPMANDAADLLTGVPGAAVVRNGAQTGIVQLRGLFNERVRVRVDGMSITPACPNHMDPPLHYAGLEAIDTLDVIVGATPVSQGGDSLVGSVEARSRAPDFSTEAAWQPQARVEWGYMGGNDGRQAAVELDAYNDRLNLRYLGGFQEAGNYESARGGVATTGYRQRRDGIVGALKYGSGVWQLEAGTHRARDVGTPTLPMDMVRDDADGLRLAFNGDSPLGKLDVGVYRHEIDHMMDNFSLRPLTGLSRMQAPATSEDTGIVLSFANPAGRGTVKMGLEILANDFAMTQQNLTAPGQPMQDTFRDSQRNRYGVYGEWEGAVAPRLRVNAGMRGELVRMDTGDLVNVFMPNVAAAGAFNALDHARSDTNLDATVALSYALKRGVNLEGALTRRTRSPSVLERYLWTPTSASAGQADGRTYLGNLDLEAEVAHGLNLGIKLKERDVRAQAALFWQDVSDFIQGQPIGMLDSNGLPVLQYTNVNARLWGGEASLNQKIGAFDLGVWASFTRGENTDNGDPLYRLAPLRGGVSLGYETGLWQFGGEWLLSARKDEVAAYNNELETPGYGVLNLHATYKNGDRFKVAAGIDNMLDALYYDPLAGVNRVTSGSVPVNTIMPAMGRSLYVKMNWTY